MGYSEVTSFLKTKTGLYLKVDEGTLKLEATEVQNETQNATLSETNGVFVQHQDIWTLSVITPRVLVIHNRNTWMAFCFENGKKHYLLKEVKEKLTLEVYQDQKGHDLSVDYWFQKVDLGSGEHIGLQTVRSNQYLCIQTSETSSPSVILTEHKQNCLSVRRMEAST